MAGPTTDETEAFLNGFIIERTSERIRELHRRSR
jgi:hypothetical protein